MMTQCQKIINMEIPALILRFDGGHPLFSTITRG